MKSWLGCPNCPLLTDGDASGCCVALRAALRKAAKQNSERPSHNVVTYPSNHTKDKSLTTRF